MLLRDLAILLPDVLYVIVYDYVVSLMAYSNNRDLITYNGVVCADDTESNYHARIKSHYRFVHDINSKGGFDTWRQYYKYLERIFHNINRHHITVEFNDYGRDPVACMNKCFNMLSPLDQCEYRHGDVVIAVRKYEHAIMKYDDLFWFDDTSNKIIKPSRRSAKYRSAHERFRLFIDTPPLFWTYHDSGDGVMSSIQQLCPHMLCDLQYFDIVFFPSQVMTFYCETGEPIPYVIFVHRNM